MKVHIGNKIKQLLYEKQMTVSEFAERIGVTRNSAYNMLKKELLLPKWIAVISKVLGDDLSRLYYAADGESSLEKLNEQVNTLQAENEQLKKENGYLKEINELLKKK